MNIYKHILTHIFQSVLSNGFIFALVWDPVENSYINPNEYKATRIDFNKERGKVSNNIFDKKQKQCQI